MGYGPWAMGCEPELEPFLSVTYSKVLRRSKIPARGGLKFRSCDPLTGQRSTANESPDTSGKQNTRELRGRTRQRDNVGRGYFPPPDSRGVLQVQVSRSRLRVHAR